MKIKRITMALAVAALGSGTMATVGGANFIEKKVDERTRAAVGQIRKEMFLVPISPLEIGAKINRTDLSVRELPADGVHRDALRPEQLKNIVGKTIKSAVTPNAPILQSQINFTDYNGLVSLVADDERVITVAVNPLSSISGMLKPEDRVDVLYTANGREQASTVTLLTDLRVLATGQLVGAIANPRTIAQNQGFNTVTLACDAIACQKLTHAQTRGELSFVLSRNKSAVEDYPVKTTEADLLRLAPPPKPVKPKPKKKAVAIYAAGKRLN